MGDRPVVLDCRFDGFPTQTLTVLLVNTSASRLNLSIALGHLFPHRFLLGGLAP